MLLWNGTSIGVPRPCKFWYRQRAWVVYFLFIGKRAGGGVKPGWVLELRWQPGGEGIDCRLWAAGGGVEALPVNVFLDGIESEAPYSGAMAGLWQVNVRIPEFAMKGAVVWRVGVRENQEGILGALR